MILQCSKDDALVNPDSLSLTLIDARKIPINEPSGLSLGKFNQSLWVVTDAPENEIYEISLEGEILQKLDFKGEDLEGIVYDSLKNVLLVVEEKKREIIEVALDGTELSRHSFNIEGNDNNGFEGIAINPSGQIWIANEKEPVLLGSLNSDFSVKSLVELNIAADYSGLSFGDQDDQIWIVSDESQLVIHYDTTTEIVKKYNLTFDKAEGICVDTSRRLVYIARESSNRLLTYEF
jgi:uncharacterized protein YjiK